MQLDAMALYQQHRRDSDYRLDNLDFDTMEKHREEGKVKYDQATDTYHVDCGNFSSPNRSGIVYTEEALRDAYAVYNLQMVRLEEVISAQRRLDEVIAKKRKKDPNYNVTVLYRDGSMP
ncbi:hypothetical protein PHABIO_110 [Pseudomonas phage Phabio]|uniref:Uncharacterized protein n=1 Tax=Pseudomonas phage Phabio TaxID=2006668 RepID=A0A1Y0STD7_9CAUD|nr:hypothetical protein MZD05_gp110 [Pseudomonas phage Phabio]ARV76741.1 hypothetical protein PHABIO_110 [Pseudomonas phage Phabio]